MQTDLNSQLIGSLDIVGCAEPSQLSPSHLANANHCSQWVIDRTSCPGRHGTATWLIAMDKNSCKHIPPSSVCGRALKLNILPILSSTTTLSFRFNSNLLYHNSLKDSWCSIHTNKWSCLALWLPNSLLILGNTPWSKRDKTHDTRRSNEQPTCPSHCRQYYLCGTVVPGTCWLADCKHPFHKGIAHQTHHLESDGIQSFHVFSDTSSTVPRLICQSAIGNSCSSISQCRRGSPVDGQQRTESSPQGATCCHSNTGPRIQLNLSTSITNWSIWCEPNVVRLRCIRNHSR